MKRLIWAEVQVLWRRPTGRMALAVGTFLPVLAAFMYGSMSDSTMELNNQAIGEMLNFSGPDAALKGLFARHFYVMPLFWVALVGQSIAGERADHMLRERAVRAVSRDQLFLSKLLSLWLFSIVSLLAGTVLSLLFATPWLGVSGPWLEFFGSVGLSVFTDLGVIAVAMMLATWVRSSTMVVVSGLLMLGLDGAIRLGLSGLGLLGITWAPTAHQIMWGSGLGVWANVGGDWSWLSFGALIVWTTVALFQARYRLNRLDLP